MTNSNSDKFQSWPKEQTNVKVLVLSIWKILFLFPNPWLIGDRSPDTWICSSFYSVAFNVPRTMDHSEKILPNPPHPKKITTPVLIPSTIILCKMKSGSCRIVMRNETYLRPRWHELKTDPFSAPILCDLHHTRPKLELNKGAFSAPQALGFYYNYHYYYCCTHTPMMYSSLDGLFKS